MLFHFSFCSLYKNDFEVTPYLLRYLNKNLSSQAEHFYIQIQEQKRRKLHKSGVLSDPSRVILTNKSIQKVIEECQNKDYTKIIVEVSSGSREELALLKQLNDTKIPVSVFTHCTDNKFLLKAQELNVSSLFHLTDLFNLKTRF